MDTGKVVKIIKNVPQPIPVELPGKKKNTGNPITTPQELPIRGIPVQIPKRKKVEVENWNTYLNLR